MKQPRTSLFMLIALELRRSWHWLLIGWGLQLGFVVAGLLYGVDLGDYLLPFIQVMFVTLIAIIRSRFENDYRMALLPVKQWEIMVARTSVLLVAFGSIYPVAILLYLVFSSTSAVQTLEGLIIPGITLTVLLVASLLFSQDLARLIKNSVLRYLIHVAGLIPFAITYVGLPPQMSSSSKEFLVTSLKQPPVQVVIAVLALGLLVADVFIFDRDDCVEEYSHIRGEVITR